MQKSSKPSKSLVDDIVEQHNMVRSNPKSYIPILEKQIKLFKGNVMYKPGSDVGIETTEGKSAYQECIEFLKKQKALGKLTYDAELSRASQDHADDIGPSGSCDHTGSDGSNSDQRISRYVEWDVTICENIDFGATTGEDIIISLIVDDGVKSRGHRTNIFNDKIKFVGIGMADHAEYGVCTVLNYCGGISSYKKAGAKVNASTSVKTPVGGAKIGLNANVNLTSKPVESKTNDRTKSVKNIDDEQEKINALKGLLINRDKSSTVSSKGASKTTANSLAKDFSKKVKVDDALADDPDAPEGAISVSVKVTTKKVGKRTEKKIIKTYTLDDGTQEILEIDEIEE